MLGVEVPGESGGLRFCGCAGGFVGLPVLLTVGGGVLFFYVRGITVILLSGFGLGVWNLVRIG